MCREKALNCNGAETERAGLFTGDSDLSLINAYFWPIPCLHKCLRCSDKSLSVAHGFDEIPGNWDSFWDSSIPDSQMLFAWLQFIFMASLFYQLHAEISRPGYDNFKSRYPFQFKLDRCSHLAPMRYYWDVDAGKIRSEWMVMVVMSVWK